MTSRFSFSMPGRRGPGDPWFRIGTLEVTTTVLVVLLGVVSMVVGAFAPPSVHALILDPDKVRQGQVWRIVTWPLYNPVSIWSAITLFIFWYIGRQVEEFMGRARFAWLLFLLALIPGLVALALSTPIGSLVPSGTNAFPGRTTSFFPVAGSLRINSRPVPVAGLSRVK